MGNREETQLLNLSLRDSILQAGRKIPFLRELEQDISAVTDYQQTQRKKTR